VQVIMTTAISFDVAAVRADFPILRTSAHGKPLVYLDNAATTQKPQVVLDALAEYYTSSNANVHRGVHYLSGKATDQFEAARAKVARFIGAGEARELIFTRNATEGINLVAQTWGRANVHIVPWYMLAAEKGAHLRVIPMFDSGELDLAAFHRLLSPRTRLVAISALSNALGTVTPLPEIIKAAHEAGALVLVDGAQAAYHMPVDVRALDCDFFVLTGHKLYGPTGIGALYGKAALLEAMPPWMGGGDMIASVTFERCTWNVVPNKFEAGTPDISGAIGLGVAVDYVCAIGMDRIQAYEQELLAYGTKAVSAIDGLTIVGTAPRKASILSFVMDGIHPHDLGTIVDREGVAIRTGQHCAQPVMDRLGIPATARASLAMYNTREDIDALAAALRKARQVFG
jgi:cysteine desulfurase/selenocysteine lyase